MAIGTSAKGRCLNFPMSKAEDRNRIPLLDADDGRNALREWFNTTPFIDLKPFDLL